MTAKEKAFELFGKYDDLLTGSMDIGWKKEAKRCALICVDEIISANPHSNPLKNDVYSTMGYWLEVKREIEAL